MTFAWPQLFWLLLVPVALLAGELARRRRAAAVHHPKIVHAEASTHHLSFVAKPAARHRGRWWLCAGLIFCVVALTRPQWGRIEEPVFDQAREILIAIDLSRSMLTPDVKPSRLDRAKLLTQSLLEKLSGERVGLVSFAGTAFLQSPLSSDYEILREFLPALGPDFLPQGGTNYRALLETSLAAFGTGTADRYLIVLSDGEATDADWQSAAAELKKKNIRVIGLGIGTTTGGMIPDGAGAFVKDERGAVVLSKLESGTLQELASTTGGTYRDASTWLDLAGVLSTTVEAGQKGRFMEKNTVRLVERFQWPLALGLWCLLVSFCYEFPVRPRPRDLKLAVPARPPAPPARPAAATLLLAGLWLAGLGFPTSAPAVADPAPLVKIVGRLSTQDARTARDWAEMARETTTWGQRIQEEQRPVPEGPVQDALAAVGLGSKLDAKAADWPKLREELEALLQKPEPQKQDQQQKQNQQQEQNQSQDQQKQDQQNQQQQPQDKSKQDSSSGQSQPQKDQQQQNSSENQKTDPDEKKPGQSAFGDMQQRDQPPPSSPDSQKVGGVPEKKEGEKTPVDPSLALPLQKLDQLRNQDSPGQLFQLMDGDKKSAAPKKKGKDW